ncbi:MAG: phenylalanine--tRNA ligase beta subunit-related protein [Ilumatobacteraceae bacterium]
MNRFRYDSDVQIRFPDLATAVVTITDVDNTIDPPDLTTEIATQTDAVRRRLAEQPVAEMPSITAWRRVFTSFGTKPTRYRNAAEALLRRIGGQNDLPALNPLTDLANLVSISHAVPVAVFDLDAVAGTISVRFASGTEQFHGVGTDEVFRRGAPSPRNRPLPTRLPLVALSGYSCRVGQ